MLKARSGEVTLARGYDCRIRYRPILIDSIYAVIQNIAIYIVVRVPSRLSQSSSITHGLDMSVAKSLAKILGRLLLFVWVWGVGRFDKVSTRKGWPEPWAGEGFEITHVADKIFNAFLWT